jgi:hypothetical protein
MERYEKCCEKYTGVLDTNNNCLYCGAYVSEIPQKDPKEANDIERSIRQFCNHLAMQLTPSNEAMKAVRWAREELSVLVKNSFCEKCYEDKMQFEIAKKDAVGRFMSKVKKTSNGCWIWQAFKQNDGYSRFTFMGRSMVGHRASYQIFKGELDPEKHIHHVCNTPSCVNPEHLEQISPQENYMISNSFSAKNARKTHCHRGHVFDEANTNYSYYGKDKSMRRRQCRACWRLKYRKRKHLKALTQHNNENK